MPKFDTFIAIDWSGAARRYDGIAVAVCDTGGGAPRLIQPADNRWTRQAIADWLENRLEKGRRMLVGLDFSFGFPFEPQLGYLGGAAAGVDEIFALWSLIESKSGGEPDFGCSRFIADPDYEHLFWKAGPRPPGWIDRKRRTELACVEATRTRPDTLYKLLHSKQVGKASITGIRVLHQIRSRSANRVSIWPFETVRFSAVVEIYPTMFRKLAAGSVAKLRSLSALNKALANIGSRPVVRSMRAGELSDHETDALISVAGLRWIARDPAVWTTPQSLAAEIQREGWIFGVRAGDRFGRVNL